MSDKNGDGIDEMLALADPQTGLMYLATQAIHHLAKRQLIIEVELKARLDEHERRIRAIEEQLGITGREPGAPAQGPAGE